MFNFISNYFKNRRQKKYDEKLIRMKSNLKFFEKQLEAAKKDYAWAFGGPEEVYAFDRLFAACNRYINAVNAYNCLVRNPPK